MEKLSRITLDPEIMGGKACIRGLRVTAATIVGLLAAGRAADEILAAYPYLEPEDIDQALAYAAWRLERSQSPFERVADPCRHEPVAGLGTNTWNPRVGCCALGFGRGSKGQ